MMSIEQLCRDLLRVSEDISGYEKRMEREREETRMTMEKVQSTFGDQTAGQQIVAELYYCINDLAKADSSFYMIRSMINEYINSITK